MNSPQRNIKEENTEDNDWGSAEMNADPGDKRALGQ